MINKLNKIIIILTVLFFSSCLFFESEKVEWENPFIFTSREFQFKTNLIRFQSLNNKVFEIKTKSGVTGFYVVGSGQIKIEKDSIDETVTAALIRFNPDDLKKYITISNKDKIEDRVFIDSTMSILKNSFRHSYHANMNALIPEEENYSVNFFSKTVGEVIASYYNGKIIMGRCSSSFDQHK